MENNMEAPQTIKEKNHMILQWFRILNALSILFNFS